MPLPTPNSGESQSHFISRCISVETKASPDRNPTQIQAMCYTKWRNSKGVKQSVERTEMKKTISDILNMTIIDLKESKVDEENSIIRSVSILSSNALDSNGEIFRKFTDNALNDAVTIFDGALARIDHDRNSGDSESRGVRAGYGVYRNIRLDGGKIFGDLHLWDCEDARKVLSIANRTPNAVGNSIHAGARFYEDDDGIEIVEQLLPRTTHGFKPSIDLVEDPAATIGLYQSRKSKSKETEMEFKDLTLETIKTNRPDLEKLFFDEGSASRDDEVKTLATERDDAKKKLDELSVKQSKSERTILVDRMLVESELPDYAKTEIFRSQLINVKESKDGDKTISVEDGIKSLIQDRIDALESDGVHDNSEKNIKLTKGAKVDDDEFAETFGDNQQVIAC